MFSTALIRKFIITNQIIDWTANNFLVYEKKNTFFLAVNSIVSDN